jgi:RNA polymerase sigma-70 factor (ECF subfamily)
VTTADLELAGRCRAGDPAAFEELYRAYAGRLFNIALRMTGSASDAEDLLQEIFLLVYRKLSAFRGDSSLGTWLYRVAMNCCLDRVGGRRARMERVTDSFADDDVAEPVARESLVPQTLTRMDLERAIARLPPGSRAAFVLHHVEGFDHKEVAQILGVTEGTSKSQVHKARLRLRELLTTAGVTAERRS